MLNILIVDDSKVNRVLLENLLKNYKDINVIQAKNGKEAIDIVKKNNINIIFMDIEMPVLNGIQATEYIKRLQPKIIIIAVSSYNNKKLQNMMFKVGAEDYLTKPINKTIISNKLNIARKLIEWGWNERIDNTIKNMSSSSIDKNSDIKMIFNLKNEESMRFIWNFIIVRNREIFNKDFISTLLVCFFDVVSNFAKKGNDLSILLIYKDIEKKMSLVLKGIKITQERENSIKILFKQKFTENNYIDIFDLIKIEYKKNFIIAKLSLNENIDNLEITENDWLDLDDDFCDLDDDDDDLQEDKKNMMKYLNTTHLKISAIEFLETHKNDYETMLEVLKEVQDGILDIIEILYEDNLEVHQELIAKTFKDFSVFLNIFGSFNELRHILDLLSNLILDISFDKKSNTTKYYISEIIKTIFEDILDWQKHVFYEQDTVDVFYINASIFNSFLQLEDMLKTLK